MRPLALHASALNNDEYEAYTAALRDLGEIEPPSAGSGVPLQGRQEGQDGEGEWYDDVTLSVREVRAWLRGRYAALGAGVLDQILKFFSPSEVLTSAQFFAVLRLVTHVQNGRELDRGLAFVQAHPQTQSVHGPATPKLSAPTPPTNVPRPPPRRKRSATFDSSSTPFVPSAPVIQPPQHPSHHSQHQLGQGLGPGLKPSSVQRAVPLPPTAAGGGAGPPLPLRKPMMPPPPGRTRSISPQKSTQRSDAPTLAPPPPPPRPGNVPPIPPKPVFPMISSTSSSSSSSTVKEREHHTSELMKQSLQASKLASAQKRYEAEKEKERVMRVLKSSASGPSSFPFKSTKPGTISSPSSSSTANHPSLLPLSQSRSRSPTRPPPPLPQKLASSSVVPRPAPPPPPSSSSISSLSEDGRRPPRAFSGYAPSIVSSTSTRVSRSSMEQVALAPPPTVGRSSEDHAHDLESMAAAGRAPPPPPSHPDRKPVPPLPPRDRSASRAGVTPLPGVTVQRRHTLTQGRGDYAPLGDDNDAGSVGSFDEVYSAAVIDDERGDRDSKTLRRHSAHNPFVAGGVVVVAGGGGESPTANAFPSSSLGVRPPGKSPFHSPFHSNSPSPLGSPRHSRSGSLTNSPFVPQTNVGEDGGGDQEATLGTTGGSPRTWRSHSLHYPRGSTGLAGGEDGGDNERERETKEVLSGVPPFGRKPRPQSMRVGSSPREGIFADSAHPSGEPSTSTSGLTLKVSKRRSFQPPPQHYTHGMAPAPPPHPPHPHPHPPPPVPSSGKPSKGEMGTGIGIGLGLPSLSLSRHASLKTRPTSGHRKSSLSVSSLPLGGGIGGGLGLGLGRESKDREKERDWSSDPKYHHYQQHQQQYPPPPTDEHPHSHPHPHSHSHSQPVFAALDRDHHHQQQRTDPLLKFASSTREKLERFERQITPRLEKARFKAEAGLSRRGFVPSSSSSSAQMGAAEMGVSDPSTSSGPVLSLSPFDDARDVDLDEAGVDVDVDDSPYAQLEDEHWREEDGVQRTASGRDRDRDRRTESRDLELWDNRAQAGWAMGGSTMRTGHGAMARGVYSSDESDESFEGGGGGGRVRGRRWQATTTATSATAIATSRDGTTVDRGQVGPEEGWRALP